MILITSSLGSLDSCVFHECVTFPNWETSKVLECVAPDGQFVLFHFSTRQDSIEPPMQIYTLVEEGPSGAIELSIKVNTLFLPLPLPFPSSNDFFF